VINAARLLADLTRQLKRLEDDLRQRIAELPELRAGLQAEWQAARDADRCAETFESWAEQVLTQAGVHWLLSCVFIRFIEDNGLVDRPWLAGTPQSGRLALARDRHEAFFRARPHDNDRDYLLSCFRDARALPGLQTFFDEAHNPVFRLGISGDAAMALLRFWTEVDADSGRLRHDFEDPAQDTRFLGDLYQDLSEATRKRYALLQTPEFVEEFILDRTLTPALREFGLRDVRLIDPTCGSGHFLLGAFHRLVDEWRRTEPGANSRDVAQRALDAVAGVDLNPFAVAIARFRLWVAALNVAEWHAGLERGAPNFRVHVAIGDSLLHGRRFGLTATDEMFRRAEHFAGTGLAHAYASEDLDQVNEILGRQYHAVVGNPPYIVVKDAALNAAYRHKYPAACHMKYSLGAPFTQRFFELAVTGGDGRPAGRVGLITANSFMKREFGSKLIEQVLPMLDLTHVVDTSGAYIPGHGTPTVILFGRHRKPVEAEVRTVMGIKGEPSTPDDPAQGQVWSAIVGQIDVAGSESEFVSVADTPRATFAKHPWSIGGGGAAELKDAIEAASREALGTKTTAMGFFGISAADEVMLADAPSLRRFDVETVYSRPLISGDEVRDWASSPQLHAVFPYDTTGLIPLNAAPGIAKWLWPHRTFLGNRVTFAKRTYFEEGRPWWEWHQIALDRIRSPLTITFGEVATHNHFVLDRGGKVFNRTAPVIKLPAGSSEDEHLGLLGLLNSSVACFWLKQVCFPKGGDTVGGEGARVRKTLWDERYAINASNVAEFPLAPERPVALAATLDSLARQIGSLLPAALLGATADGAQPLPTRAELDAARERVAALRRLAVAWQEELDWACYGLYGLLDTGVGDLRWAGEPPEVKLGERAFEIVLARRVATGKEATAWFERHGSTPLTEIPSHWPEGYRALVQRRIDLIERDRNIGLIERPEYKRRWNTPSWDELERAALRNALLDRLEAHRLWRADDDHPPQLTTAGRLADALRADAGFVQLAELYAGDSDLGDVVAGLVASESVPFLPVLRYTETGLRKRAQWEDTWALQRREDAGENVGRIPVPPKYQGKDFLKADFWRLRGGLDVPKERWVSYPGCERGADSSLVIGWAGWDHLQQATALAALYLEMKDHEGWPRERLQPLLAGLQELLPWLAQWHDDPDPRYGERMGQFYAGFVEEQAREQGWTLDDLRAWRPAVTATRRGRPRKVAG